MGNVFHIAHIELLGDQVVVQGYVEGKILLETLFTDVCKHRVVRTDKSIYSEPTGESKPICLKVVRICAYEKELPELYDLAGTLFLTGDGFDRLEIGDVLC